NTLQCCTKSREYKNTRQYGTKSEINYSNTRQCCTNPEILRIPDSTVPNQRLTIVMPD
ncbi:hypothetical protein NDU88_001129, partial [Pleurodeles waltl]